jgi:hypothetical protein
LPAFDSSIDGTAVTYELTVLGDGQNLDPEPKFSTELPVDIGTPHDADDLPADRFLDDCRHTALNKRIDAALRISSPKHFQKPFAPASATRTRQFF